MERRKRREKAGRPWSKRIPDGPWDDIVIGSGMGGMTAAALLADLGRRVLVLEQHYVPGGFTHTFNRPGYSWDVGVHAVGEVTERSLTGRLLKRLSRGRLRWASLGPVYDEFHYPDGFRIDFPDHPATFRENLEAAFPKERAAIADYFQHVRGVSRAMKGYYMARLLPAGLSRAGELLIARDAQKLLEERTADVVARLTDDERLRAVLTAQWGYYGSPPSRSSFAIQALVSKHFLHGGYYPVGGSQQIAIQLLQTLADCGGWCAIATPVKRILLESGRACGVELEDGRRIAAKRIISAAGVLATLKRMLPDVQTGAWTRSIEQLQTAPAHVCLYLGFKGDIREAGASPANKWFYNTYDCEQEAWQVTREGAMPPAPVLYCSFPSLKDPQHDPGSALRHTGEVVTFVPWQTFAPWRGSRWKKRGADYEAFKQRMHDSLLQQFFEKMPLLRDKLDYAELSTPLTTDHFCRPMAGSIYGLEPTPERFKNRWLRPRSPIEGLFFAGSEVATVGVIGAMMGGVLAAAAAEPVAAMRYLRNG